MHVQRFKSAEALAAHRSAWDELASDIPFRQFDWAMSWWQCYTEDGELYVLGVFDHDRLVALAPWYVQSDSTGGRVLRFLGDGEVCSDYLDLLVAEGQQEPVLQAIVQWLQEALTTSDAWDAMLLEAIAHGTLHISQLVGMLQEHDARTSKQSTDSCWRLELPESWYDYEMTQSKSHRKQIRRLIKRVLDTDRCHLDAYQDAESIEKAMPILIDLHNRRRRMLDQPGCFASPKFAEFLPTAAKLLTESGQCEILVLTLDNQPLAAEIHFPSKTISYAYQAGIDPDRMDEDPGSLMQIAAIRRAIEQGRTAIDFLRGDEPYKAHWRAEPVACETIRLVPNTTFGLIRHGIWTTKAQVKNWVKSSLGMS